MVTDSKEHKVPTALPTLYKRTSTGKIQTWEIRAEGTAIVTTYGLLDGKKQEARDIIGAGKNLGRANATTPEEQAEAEAQSQWEKKVKKGYVQTMDDAEQGKIDTNLIAGGVNPMLAHSYEKHPTKISFPAYVQPKLDGHRCVAIVQDGKCTLWSRTRKLITGVPHIARALESMFPNLDIVLDGELYNHDYHNRFEDLSSLIRSATPKSGHEVVQYWIYDVVAEGEPFERRAEMLGQIKAIASNPIVVVDTEEVENEEAMTEVFGVYLSYNFEGLMLRNKRGLYVGRRSYDLQKVKIMQDAEFEITDVTEGRGKMAGRAIFNCVTAEGKPFRAKMVGAMDDLIHYFEHKDEYIGKMLTVKYQKWSNDNVPVFPVALRIREDI